MANKYCNLKGYNKVSDEYGLINTGFDKVDQDVSELQTEVKEIVKGDANAEVGQAHVSTAKGKVFETIKDRFEEIEEDVSVNLNTVSLSLSNTDSIKSVSANVASVPKVKITAPDMLVNLLGKDGDMESLAGWSTSSSFAVLSLDSSSKMFGNNSIRMTWTHETTAQPGIVKDITSKVNPSKHYLLSAYTKCATANHVDIRFRINGSTNKTSSSSTVADKFTRLGVKISPSDMVGLIKLEILLVMGADLNEYANFDGVALYEITESEYNNLTINQLMAKYPYVNGAQPLLNPCLTVRGKNLFDKSKTQYDKSLQTNGTIVTAAGFATSNLIKIKPNTSYKIQGRTQTAIAIYDINRNLSRYLLDKQEFSTLSNECYMIMNLAPSNADNVQLEEGTVATAYESYREKQRIYPCTLGKVSTYADELEDDGVKAVKTWRVKKYVLQASDVTNITSGTTVEFATVSTANLIRKKPITTHLVDGSFIVNGWAETTGTTIAWDNEEHKWKYGKSNVTQALQFFVPKGAYANLAAAQVALAGTEIWYVLAQEEQEIIEPIGSLKLEQGYNCIDVSTGIVHERAKFVFDTNYYTNIDASLGGSKFAGSEFKYKNKNILALYKNNIIDNTAVIVLNSWAYGKHAISLAPANYDPTADYRAKYEVLHEDYNSQQVSVILEYADNLRTSHNELVENVAGLEQELGEEQFARDVHENALVTGSNGVHGMKIEEGVWTPFIYGSTTAGVNTYSKQIGLYHKVGKEIFITCTIILTAKDAAMAGIIRIGGLPYLTKNTADARFGFSIFDAENFVKDPTRTILNAFTQNNLNYIGLFNNGDNISVSSVVPSQITNTTVLIIGGTYLAN